MSAKRDDVPEVVQNNLGTLAEIAYSDLPVSDHAAEVLEAAGLRKCPDCNGQLAATDGDDLLECDRCGTGYNEVSER